MSLTDTYFDRYFAGDVDFDDDDYWDAGEDDDYNDDDQAISDMLSWVGSTR